MKFKTQHLRVASTKDGYILHRDGNTTWKTTMSTTQEVAPFEVVVHDTVAAAKAVLGNISCASK